MREVAGRLLGVEFPGARRVQGRTSPDEITLYKSVGVAVQDAAVVAFVLERAAAESADTRVDVT